MSTLLDSKDFMVYIKTDIIFEHYHIIINEKADYIAINHRLILKSPMMKIKKKTLRHLNYS